MKQMQRSKEKHRRSGHFGGADTARLVRLLGTNFTGPETAIRFRYQPPQEDQRTGGEACCRFAALLKRLRGLDRKKER